MKSAIFSGAFSAAFSILASLAVLPAPALAQSQGAAAAAPAKPRNIVIFVADGLRYGSVEPGNMPNLYRLKTEGVDFTNSHSLFPTITTVNASAIATGHYIGDTGDFGNTIYTGQSLLTQNLSPFASLENDMVLAEMNERFGGNYLNETSLIAAARTQGFSTAVIGKLGPSRIQDVTASHDGSQTLILDDNSGKPNGLGMPTWFTSRMKDAFLPGEVPDRQVPNIPQEVWLMKAATRIVLPHFKQAGKPFVLLFWSRDPDMSQHGTTDSVGEYTPGINGPSGLAGTRDADTALGELRAALKAEGLDGNTDIFVTADHGFLTVSHESKTSPSMRLSPGELRNGFLATDLALTLGLPLHDPARNNAPVDLARGQHLSGGSALLGGDPANPNVVVAANGGSDLIYLKGDDAKDNAAAIVKFLSGQDYTGAIFVNDALGKYPGTLPMSAVNLIGSARTPVPSIYVSFRSFDTGCAVPAQCAVGVHDTPLQTGHGSHGSLSRAETRNFMAAIGPDFKAGYADPAPVSNADIAPTMAHLAAITLPAKGKLTGRVIGEALKGGKAAVVTRRTLVSDPDSSGHATILDLELVGQQRYFNAAGFTGRVVGLTPAQP
jgi:arylsulfatase A-like enzyme